MSIEIVKPAAEIPLRLETEWRDLCKEGLRNAPFLRPDWFITFARNFGKRMEIVVVKANGRLRALLPIERKWGSLHGLPARKLQGVFNLNTPRFDLIHGGNETERRDVVREVWDTLNSRSEWDVVEFRLVPTDSWLIDLAALAERDGCRVGTWQMDSAPYIALGRSEDPEAALLRFFDSDRRHLRQELDRRLRRLRELGEVEFVVNDSISDEMLSRYFALEASGWKGRAGTAVTNDLRVERLHQEFASSVAKDGALRVYELQIDGRTIAMSLNILNHRQIVHWKTSYDEEFARYAPGNLLFRQLLNDCIEDGVEEIDFLSPSTPNKRSWATGEREHVAFYIFRRGLIGTALWFWKFGIGSWVRARKQQPLSNVPVQ